MSAVINSNDVIEDQPGKFFAEASSLGWGPGDVPCFVPTTLGNKQDLYLTEVSKYEFLYNQLNGCITLTVFND